MYKPTVNDYVKWKNIEGWVYFVTNEYCTIEISVKDKCDENIKDCPIHKKTHCCVVCYPEYWKELKYVKSRLSASASFTLTDARTDNSGLELSTSCD